MPMKSIGIRKKVYTGKRSGKFAPKRLLIGKGFLRIMMISSKGRYALRVMLDMAQQHGTGFIPLNEIAKRQNISRKYLESIMTEMSKHNLVESSAGKTGGYRLLKEPTAYTTGEILRAAEGDLAPVSCLTTDGKKCEGSCSCQTLPFWQGLEEHIEDYVDHYTLQDLLDANAPPAGSNSAGNNI